MRRILLLATTTGYQTRAFSDAAARLGVELVFATDRCRQIEDPWQDQAVPIRFHDEDASVTAIIESTAAVPIDGLLVVGDRPTVIGARVAERLGLPYHPPAAASAARHKQLTRERFRDAGLPVPWFFAVALSSQPSAFGEPSALSPEPLALSPEPLVALSPEPLALSPDPLALSPDPLAQSPEPLSYPCVVKPVALSGSRGVMRADDPASFAAAFERLRALMQQPEVRAEQNEAHATALVEGFIPGREFALEGLMHHGVLHVLAIFDKPDPLDGPFFEETIYLAPSSATDEVQHAIIGGVTRAARALGLRHGPIHAECRVSPSTPRSFDTVTLTPRPVEGRELQRCPEHDRQATNSGPTASSDSSEVFVLEVAARPVGGLCARALRFQSAIRDLQSAISLEELLLRHALGEDPARYHREAIASGVMMIPIPRRGILRRVDGIDEARQVAGVDEIHITAKPDQLLVPLPEGASYLGFIFARAARANLVEHTLRDAHARLAFTIDPEIPVLTPGQMHYNLVHG